MIALQAIVTQFSGLVVQEGMFSVLSHSPYPQNQASSEVREILTPNRLEGSPEGSWKLSV